MMVTKSMPKSRNSTYHNIYSNIVSIFFSCNFMHESVAASFIYVFYICLKQYGLYYNQDKRIYGIEEKGSNIMFVLFSWKLFCSRVYNSYKNPLKMSRNCILVVIVEICNRCSTIYVSKTWKNSMCMTENLYT